MNKDCTIDFSSGTCSDEKEPVPDEKNLKIRVFPYFMRVSGVFCVLGTCSGASEHVPKMVKIPLFFFNLELYHASSLFGYPEMYDFFHQHIF